LRGAQDGTAAKARKERKTKISRKGAKVVTEKQITLKKACHRSIDRIPLPLPGPHLLFPRAASEEAAASVAARGVNVSVVRLPQVHDQVRQGLITYAVALAREKGVSPYVGDGLNRWPAAHVLDTAHLYRLALEKQEPGAKYHAVAEEGVPLRDIAEVIGRGLKVPVLSVSPEEAAAHFGWLAMFVGRDAPASSAQTQKHLDWHPTGPGMITDLERMNYFER
jgi:nucleoside-diphosphate-sugar epimerase